MEPSVVLALAPAAIMIVTTIIVFLALWLFLKVLIGMSNTPNKRKR